MGVTEKFVLRILSERGGFTEDRFDTKRELVAQLANCHSIQKLDPRTWVVKRKGS